MLRRPTVGGEVDSYCGRCKLTLNHMITAMVDGVPRRVRCLTCGSEHNHRVLKAKKAKSTSRSTSSRSRKTAESKLQARWSTLTANWDDSMAKPYSIYASFLINDMLTHSKFGRGVVIEVPGPDRMITLFEKGEKMLMQGKPRA